MSNRTNAQRYSQSVRQPDVSDVDLFGVKERRRNREADAQLQRDKSWLEAQQAYEQALIDFETAKQAEIERLKAEELRTTEKTKGDIEQGRMSHEQVLKAMSDEGIPFTPENFAAFNAGVSSSRIGAASKRSSYENELMGTPGGKDMYTNMLQANMAAPGVRNSAALKGTVGPNEIATFPQGPGFAKGTPSLMTGPTAQETTSLVGGYPMTDESGKPTGQMMNQSPVTTRSFRPGSVRYPAIDFEQDNSGQQAPSQPLPQLQTKPQEGGGVPVQDILNSVLGGGQPAVGQDPYIMKLRSMFGF